jgi:5-methyltetrahydrofolate--homocysteine methyltransferase
VAGAVGPSGLGGPNSAASDAALAERYPPALRALADAGADLLWIESQWDLREALLALRAARGLGLPAVVTFGLVEAGGRLAAPGGTPAQEVLAAVVAEGAAAAGVNCVPAGRALTALAAWAASSLGAPFVAKPSPGLPGAVLPPGAFAAALAPAVEAGLEVAGGCCGATADHLRAISRLLGVAA